MSRRLNRVNEACKEQLSEILQRELKDPRIGFVTITQVRVTPDLRHAKVFISILGTEEQAEASLEGLQSAKGYLKSRLGKHLRLKYLPELEFIHEHVTEEALHLQEIMKQVEDEDEEDGSVG